LKPLFLALAGALAALPAHADPLGFKGIDLGSPLVRIAIDPRHECHALNTPLGDILCSLRSHETETIAGVPIVSVFYFYDRGVLTGIQITIAEKDFQRVVHALDGKYGAARLSREMVKNLKGELFENRTYLWNRADGSLQAQRYSGSLDKSLIRYSDDNAARRLQQRRAVAKDPMKDL